MSEPLPCPFCGSVPKNIFGNTQSCCGVTKPLVEWNRRAMPECVKVMEDFVMRCQGNLTMDTLESEADEVRAAVSKYYGVNYE